MLLHRHLEQPPRPVLQPVVRTSPAISRWHTPRQAWERIDLTICRHSGPSRTDLVENDEMDHRFVGIPELADVPRVAVVADVMRAFTVTAWALSRGTKKIVLAASDTEALALKQSHPEWLALKDGAPAPGFDTVNSSGLIKSLDLTDRTVVQKTTTGTVGALPVASAPLVLCASFVVARATARFL